MSEKPISPLRQRIVKRLASFLGRSPDIATPEELGAF
jgi:hypothetical protein